ncbi:MAG: ATP-binding cassette domain-containing protein [Candidatus Riflebacteria bacterium]|nr:ATP-binding cassette domain-containing protein [Candidatus Riflebacteria bacterium]
MLTSVYAPLLYRDIFDGAIPSKSQHLLAVAMSLLGLVYVINALAGVLHDEVSARVGALVTREIQRDLFVHLQKQSSAFYARTPEGEIVASFGPDMVALEMAMVRGLPVLISRSLHLILNTVLLFAIQWRLALASFILMPLVAIAPRWFARRARRSTKDRDDQRAAVAEVVQENLVLHLAVRAFGLEGQRLERFTAMLDTLAGHSHDANFFSSLVGRATSIALRIVQIGILGLGAHLAIIGHLTTGLFIAFIGALSNISSALDSLTGSIPLLTQGAVSLGRIRGLLDCPPAMVEQPGAKPLPHLTKELAMDRLTFGFDPEHPVLNDVSLAVPAGRSVAIVGRSGSGKSTVLSLLLRLHDPQSGRVTLDGEDLRNGTEASLRGQTGIVPQNTALFNTTIRENIRLGRLDASDEQVEAAARDAGLHDAILALPAGYDTQVGSQGALLSGGQRQRVAIARALVRKPAILFLDEATAALDAQTEQEIEDLLRGLDSNWTLVSVTHRLSQVSGYDHIIVMENGRVVESGTHVELLARGGPYASLWVKQSGFVIDERGGVQVTVDRLRAIPFLAGCGDEILEMLTRVFVCERFPAGRIVFEEGEPGAKFLLIARGRLESFVKWGDQTKRVLEVLEPGDHLGELEALERLPWMCSVTALSDTTCLSLDRARFLEIADRHPPLRDRIKASAEARIAALKKAIMEAVG